MASAILGTIPSSGKAFRLAALGLVIALSLWASFTPWQAPPPDSPVHGQQPKDRGDIALYRQVARQVAAGESYYSAAAELHRQRGYPLKPFYTMRLPTLAWLAAGAGERALVVAAWVLLLGALAAWHRRLRDHSAGERIAALVLLSLAGAPIISREAVMMHEFWCGMLLTVALAFDPRREWPAQLAFAILAFAVREFAAAFLALMLATAAVDRAKTRFIATAAATVACTAFLLLHREMVMSVVRPEDLSSESWLGLRGPAGVVDDLRKLSLLGSLPAPLAAFAAFTPLLGWCALRRGAGFTLLWFIGFGFVVAAFARPGNFYWALVLLPAYPMGFAFLPSFIRGRPAEPSMPNAG